MSRPVYLEQYSSLVQYSQKRVCQGDTYDMLGTRAYFVVSRHFSTSQNALNKLKIAIIGQSTFAAEVYKLLRKDGHKVVGVFTVPDKNNREDPLATTAIADSVPVYKVKAWRKNGKPITEILSKYKSVKADLNVLPFCSQFIPMDVINYPNLRSICYHPSLLPKHRGVSAISWTLITGEKEAGFSIFWADDGLDTGPILLQESCPVEINDTVDSLYNRFLYPQGIKAMAKAVNMVADGTAPKIPQTEEGASYEPSLSKEELQRINCDQIAPVVHNFIRGMDSAPGAWTIINNEKVKLFGSEIWTKPKPAGDEVEIEGLSNKGIIHSEGLLIPCKDETFVNVQRLAISGRMIAAAKYGKQEEARESLQLSDQEKEIIGTLQSIWEGILNIKVEDNTEFFSTGAGSMDVVRLVEEIRDKMKLTIQHEDIFMATSFKEFSDAVVLKSRGAGSGKTKEHSAIVMHVNNMEISFPHQLFINGEFVDSESGAVLETLDPNDESVICNVQCASAADVNTSVQAAKIAFENGEWSKMNARDRGMLMYKLADLMEDHKEELATIESIDSGAVYTLALKTHVGMSIDTWRYFAGWCDKIHGSTIPINHARPNRNLTFTKKEPIGVCGLVTPWNYPLMMLSWKMAACLAAGNTVVMKPAQVSPLTALKFAELSVKAGFPPGVINILPGKDSNLKKVSLELGGKSPLIIFEDCDIDRAVRMGMSGVFFNKGENCIAAGRIFVESSVHDEFVKRVLGEIPKMVIGDPLKRNTQHGPQNHKAHLDKLVEYCNIGKKEGAKLECGGRRIKRPGFFFEPTVFTNVEDHMFIAREESFGPVMIISKFEKG
ncbi:Cytosolic 10-formyltetrahydrofolate dehydrogenase [Blattella germanica]|nr:Cytosolic 10-formyltetrahydrofolate dehydrogenase [Blattella germanica]